MIKILFPLGGGKGRTAPSCSEPSEAPFEDVYRREGSFEMILFDTIAEALVPSRTYDRQTVRRHVRRLDEHPASQVEASACEYIAH